jgi:hypothetical protein
MRSGGTTAYAWMSRLTCVGMCLCGMLMPLSAAIAQAPSVAISSPRHEETLHDNTGTVAVAVSLQGETLAAGRQLRVLLDGNPMPNPIPHGGSRHTLEFTLNDVERGTHTLQVQLLDARDALIAESPVVTFHMWQASKFLPPRKPKPPPPQK